MHFYALLLVLPAKTAVSGNKTATSKKGSGMTDKLVTDDLGRNGFKLLQDEDGFKLGTASVLLAWFASSFVRRTKEDKTRMLELGSGIGSCAICTAARLSKVSIDCIEVQQRPFEILHKNIELNSCTHRIRAFNADILELPSEVKDISYDVVFMNPPFFSEERGPKTDSNSEAQLVSRFGNSAGLEDFISVASRRTRPSGGYVCMCMAASRLDECITLFEKNNVAPSRLITCHSFEDKDAFLVLLAGKKGAPNADLRILPPLILNERDGSGNAIRTAKLKVIYEEEHKDCFIS